MIRPLRKALRSFKAWRDRQRLYAAHPRLMAIDTAIAKARASHKPVRGLYAIRRKEMEMVLRGEIGPRA